MKSCIAPALAAIVVATAATSAQAATYLHQGPVGSDGGFTITFGNDGITSTNPFTDTFELTLPTGGADFVVTSTMSGGSQNITWSSITFNGEAFESGAAGRNEFNFLNGVIITEGGIQKLVLKGVGGGNAAYSGVITYMPSPAGAAPEPASWALMIGGFGAAGALLRRAKRNRTGLPVAA